MPTGEKIDTFPKNKNTVSDTVCDKFWNSCHIDNSVKFSLFSNQVYRRLKEAVLR